MARPKASKEIKEYLDGIFGPDGRVAVDELIAIAKGKAIEIHEPMEGVMGAVIVREVTATIKERIEIYILLLAYQQGRPKQQIAMDITEDNKKKYDPDRLTLEELEQLARLEAKSSGEEPIDVEFTVKENNT